MGFSLIGFGAGLAESAIDRIEEERKFSNLALQGRIERASVLKMQREKEAQAIEKDLSERLNTLKEFGVEDKDLQKAYLSAPTAFEALQKAKLSGLDVDPKALVTVNKDKLFTGTPEELIRSATRPAQQIEPARVLPSEGGSMFAPSVSGQQKRLQQFASARGMSLEDLARAESAAAPSRPEVAASINFAALKKEDKATWKQKLERYETNYADAVQQYGADSPEATRAKAAADTYRVTTSNMTEDQFDHAKKMSRAQAIMFDPKNTNVSEQDRAWAKNYLDNYENYKREQKAKGEQDEKIPTAPALTSMARTAGANNVLKQFGASAIRDQLSFVENSDGSTVVRYTGRDRNAQLQILRAQQEGAIASMAVHMPGGRVLDKKVEQALNNFLITIDKDRRPVLIDAPAPQPDREKPTLPPRAPAAAASAPTPTPLPAAAEAATPKSAQPKEGDRTKSKSGKDIVFRNGQWEYL